MPSSKNSKLLLTFQIPKLKVIPTLQKTNMLTKKLILEGIFLGANSL